MSCQALAIFNIYCIIITLEYQSIVNMIEQCFL